MGNVGRYFCVALPFFLTVGSLIALLVAGLAGVANKDLYMFRVNTTDLTINPLSLSSIVSRDNPGTTFHNINLLGGGGSSGGSSSSDSKTSNITAVDLGLANLYDISLWGYCYTAQSGSRTCTKPAFDWASNTFNESTSKVMSLISSTGQNVTLPKTVTDALEAFSTVTKWTEVVFIIAYVLLGVELFFGIFANCSRAWSCVTWIVAGLATTAVCGAASLATAMSAIVVGTVEGTAKWYGVQASLDTSFLAAVWIAAAFAIGAGFFWIFTICCCKPEHRPHRSRKHRDEAGEKLIPGSYQPLHDPEHHGGFQPHAPQYGAPRYPSGGRSDLAYEPYSHH